MRSWLKDFYSDFSRMFVEVVANPETQLLLLLLLLLLLNEYYLHAVKQKSCKSMLQT